MANNETYKYWILALSIVLLIILLIIACTCTEQFKNFAEWAKELGYPRPQGNLPNYTYGTKKKFREEEKKQWDKVAIMAKTDRIKEKFGKNLKVAVPASKTILV